MTTTSTPRNPPSAHTKIVASLLAGDSSSEQVARYFLSLGNGDASQALRVLNETHDDFNQLFTSAALHLRTSSLKSLAATSLNHNANT